MYTYCFYNLYQFYYVILTHSYIDFNRICVCLCMYVCIYGCTYVCVYVCVYMGMCGYVCVHMSVNVI